MSNTTFFGKPHRNGINKIRLLDKTWIGHFPRVKKDGNLSGDITLKAAYASSTITDYFEQDTLTIGERGSDNIAGFKLTNSINYRINTSRANIESVLGSRLKKEYIALITDDNGIVSVYGDLNNPLRFSYSKNRSGKIDGVNEYIVSLVGISPNGPAYASANSEMTATYSNNYAVDFDGVVSRMNTPILSSNAQFGLGDDFSVSLWINPKWLVSSSYFLRPIFSFNGGSGFYDNAISFFFEQQLNRLWVYKGNNAGGNAFNSEAYSLYDNGSITGLSLSKWQLTNKGNTNSNDYVHLVVNISATDNRIYIYWNGQALVNTSSLRALTSGTLSSFDKTVQKLLFGSLSTNSSYNAYSLDDTYVFDKVLSQAEITAIYNGGVPKSELMHDGLVEAFLFENNGNAEFNTANNLSNNGANFTTDHA